MAAWEVLPLEYLFMLVSASARAQAALQGSAAGHNGILVRIPLFLHSLRTGAHGRLKSHCTTQVKLIAAWEVLPLEYLLMLVSASARAQTALQGSAGGHNGILVVGTLSPLFLPNTWGLEQLAQWRYGSRDTEARAETLLRQAVPGADVGGGPGMA